MLGTSPTQRGLKLPTKFVSAFAAFALVFSLSVPTFALSDDDAAPVLPVDSQVGGTESGDTEAPASGDEAEGEPEEVEPAPVADEPIVEEPAADEPFAPAPEPGTEPESGDTDESAADEPGVEEPSDEPSQQQIDPLGSLFALTADEPAAEWNPEVTVFLADGTTPYTGQALEAGAELVVKGTGFDPEANVGGRGVPIPAYLSQGTYVLFGSFADNWRPSAGAPSSNRVLNSASQGWVLTESVVDQVSTDFQDAIRKQWVELNDSGEFTATITLHTPSAPLADGNWGIYTYAASGVNNAAQETYTPINYFAPSVQVFLEDGTTPYVDQQIFEGDKLVVKGTGFSPSANKVGTRLPIPAGHSGGTYVVFGSFADNWVPSAGAPSGTRKLSTQARSWVLHEDVIAAMDDQYKPTVLAQWAELSDEGEFTATIEMTAPAEPLEDGNWGIYTYAAGGPNNAKQEIYTPVNYAKQRAELEVFLSDGETPYDGRPVYTGDNLVVKGSNYLADDNIGGTQLPIPSELSKGNYVVFGNFADSWQPSAGEPSSSRGNIFQRWVLPQEVIDQVPAIASQAVALQNDDTFSFEFTVPAPGDRSLLDRNWGIYSYAAGGIVNAKYELSIPINFLGARDTFTPEIAVYLADGKTRYTGQEMSVGDKLVVKGVGFDPAANVGGSGVPIPADLPQGTYVVFGSFADNWRPSAGAPSSNRVLNRASQGWVLTESVVDQVPTNFQDAIRNQWVELSDSGEFTATITLHTPDSPISGGNWGIYTYAAGVGTPPNAEQELSRLIKFNAGQTGGTPEVPKEPELEAGILRWGISSTFLNYLEGQAGGSVTASAGATRTDGNLFEFPQAEGSTYNPASGTGEVPYRGVVKFFGHGIDMGNITAPSIKIINANSAKLYATFGDGRVHLANIDLTKATKKVNAGVVSYTNAPVEFTSEGIQKVFAGSPPSDGGVALSFAIGSAAKPKPGESNEGGSNSSNGSNSGSKPDVEIPVEIPQTEEEQQEREERYACYADSAALKWGFSERFRAYVSGTAYGDWSASGGATYSTPQFAWGNGSGSLDSKSAAGVVGFTGSINFTGHSGVLNTTVANPAVEISGGNAYLLLDVAGTTQMGNAVTAKQIRFATLNLARAHSSVAGHTTTFTGVPVVLTQAGSNAFGTYPAGFGMDSLNFTYTLNPDCGDVRAIAGKLGDTDAAAATDGEIELDEEMIAEALGDSDDSATDTEDDAANTQHDDDAPVAAVTVPANGANSGGGLPLAVWIVLAVLVLAGGAGGIVLALRPKKATI